MSQAESVDADDADEGNTKATVFNHEMQAGDVLKRNLRGVGPVKAHRFTGEVLEKFGKTLLVCEYGEAGIETDHIDHVSVEKMEERIKHGAMLLNASGETIYDRFYANPKKFY